MSAARKRTPRACLQCSKRKVRCEKDDGEERCTECSKHGLVCEPRAHPPRHPCDACRRGHLGCDRPGGGPCTHCTRAGTPCSFCQPPESSSSGSETGSHSGPPTVSSGASDGHASPSPPAQRRAWIDVVL